MSVCICPSGIDELLRILFAGEWVAADGTTAGVGDSELTCTGAGAGDCVCVEAGADADACAWACACNC